MKIKMSKSGDMAKVMLRTCIALNAYKREKMGN